MTIKDAVVTNEGWRVREIDPSDMSLPEATRIRGFVIDKEGAGAATSAPAVAAEGGCSDESTPACRCVSVQTGSTVVS